MMAFQKLKMKPVGSFILCVFFIIIFLQNGKIWWFCSTNRTGKKERQMFGRKAGGIYNPSDAQGILLSLCLCVCLCVLFIVLIGVISSEQPTAASESHAAMQHVNQQQASWLSPKYTPSWASVYVSAYLCEVRVSLRFLIKIENCLFVHMCVEDN